MGVHNRDYMSKGAGAGVPWRGGRATWWLIGINVGLWVVFAGAFHWGSSRGFRPAEPVGGLAGFVWAHLSLRPEAVFGSWELWQPFTAFWIHDPRGIGHVFWNMLLLFFFGRSVEDWLGPRRMVRLYVGGGLASTLLLLPWPWLTGERIVAFGASGAVYGVMVWLALREPGRPVYLLFFLRMPLWVLVAVFMVGKELLELGSGSSGAASAVGHLAGAAWGWLYHQRLGRSKPATDGPGAWIVRAKRRREAERAERSREEEARTRARVDALLAKIHAEGIAALTEEEKAFLQQASQRYK